MIKLCSLIVLFSLSFACEWVYQFTLIKVKLLETHVSQAATLIQENNMQANLEVQALKQFIQDSWPDRKAYLDDIHNYATDNFWNIIRQLNTKDFEKYQATLQEEMRDWLKDFIKENVEYVSLIQLDRNFLDKSFKL